MRHVLMSHKELDGRIISVPETAAPIHMASGWVIVEGEKAEAQHAEAESAALASPVEAVDPARSTRRSAVKE